MLLHLGLIYKMIYNTVKILPRKGDYYGAGINHYVDKKDSRQHQNWYKFDRPGGMYCKGNNKNYCSDNKCRQARNPYLAPYNYDLLSMKIEEV